jgi:hypothetical protein
LPYDNVINRNGKWVQVESSLEKQSIGNLKLSPSSRLFHSGMRFYFALYITISYCQWLCK